MPSLVRAEHGQDFLALIPSIAGFRPRDCVVFVAFSGSRVLGAYRYALPRAGRGERDALASLAVGTLCRIPEADGVVPVVYTRRPFGGGRPPLARLAEGLAERFEQSGFAVRDLLVVAGDGWGSLFDEELPAGGRSLELVEQSEAPALVPPIDGSDEDVAEFAVLPPRDRNRARRLAARRRRSGERLLRDAAAHALRSGAGGDDAPPPGDPLALVEAILADPEADDDTRLEQDALLLVHLDSPAVRDAVLLQIAFGEPYGRLCFLDAARVRERIALTGEDLETATLARRDDPLAARLAGLYLGTSATAPDVDRVRRAVDRLRDVAAHAPRADRAPVGTVLAWLAWSLGRGSAAGVFVDRALAADPGYGFAQLMHTLLGSGVVPEWAFAAAGANAPGRRRA